MRTSLTVYSKPACVQCDATYRALDKKDADYVSIDISEDQAAAGDQGKVMGVAYVYTPINWAEIYAAYKRHSLNRTTTLFEDIDIVLVGTRVKF